MIVTRLRLEGFMGHDRALELELPDRGLVLVTGPNGAGKSSLVEAVSFALYGKTLRGTAPWKDKLGSVELELPDLRVRREPRKGSAAVQVWVGGREIESATATKATELIAEHVPTDDVWSSCCVFSSTEIEGAFSRSSAGDRLRFLERVFGLGTFDAPAKAAGQRLRAAETAIAASSAARDQAARWLEDHRARAPESELPPGPRPDPARARAEAEEAKGRADALSHYVERARRRRSELARELAISTPHVEAPAVHDAETCPTCLRPAGPAEWERVRAANRERVEAERAGYRAARREILSLLEYAEADLEVATRDLPGLLRTAQAARAAAQAAEADLARWTRDEARESASRALEEKAEAEVARLDLASTVAREEAAIARAVAEVFGLAGVRSRILSRGIGGVDAIARNYFSRIAEGATLAVRSFAERKDGRSVPSIEVDVEGWGGGQGYWACSGGQRRRIDIALLLAQAVVAGAARGAGRADLWFDEAFDSLDEAGVEAVGLLLLEIARDRKVVLISHSSALVEALEGAAALRLRLGE